MGLLIGLLVLFAIFGGFAIHKLLWLLIVVALVIFLFDRRRV